MSETKTERKKRLAEALRTNLRRRKVQGREQQAPVEPQDDAKQRD